MIMAALLVIFFAATTVDGCCSGGYGWFPGCRICPVNTFDKRRDNNGVPSNAGALQICPAATPGMNLYSKRNSVHSGWYTACYNCPSGWFQPTQGRYECITCPSGIFSNGACVSCQAGQYTSGGSCVDCAAGQYSASVSTSCTTCIAGRYCAGTGETTNNNLCSAGSYGSQSGQTSSACNGECPVGQYCIAGSTSGTNCPAGTMAASSSGLSKSNQCVACAAGYTCTAGRGPVGSTSPPAACGTSGGNVFYCPGGSQTSTRIIPQAGCVDVIDYACCLFLCCILFLHIKTQNSHMVLLVSLLLKKNSIH